MAEDTLEPRPVEIVRQRPVPLRVREGDIPELALGYVLARCYYCHEEYIPLKIEDYSHYVVYNCGCHKEPIDWEAVIFGSIVMAGLLLGIGAMLYPVWRHFFG